MTPSLLIAALVPIASQAFVPPVPPVAQTKHPAYIFQSRECSSDVARSAGDGSSELDGLASRLGISRPESLPPPKLSSAYDINLPAGLRGEAVRSALRSERGICLDFTSDKYPSNANVGLVKVEGRGTLGFLDGKFTNSFAPDPTVRISYRKGNLVEACLLTARGRTIDKIVVPTFAAETDAAEEGSVQVDAYLLTSPGHSGSTLFNRLDPFVFPMDGVKLTDMCPDRGDTDEAQTNTRVFTLAATRVRNVRETVRKFVMPEFDRSLVQSFDFPEQGESIRLRTVTSSGSNLELLVLPVTFMPRCTCEGYTFVLTETTTKSNADANSAADTIFQRIWDNLTAEDNDQGPVEVGPLEWESLRIEGGWPAYGCEMTGDSNNAGDSDTDNNDKGAGIKASPLELRLDSTVDDGKGCYLGQEAVAALLKNKRGIPRLLYSVVFSDDDNAYEHLQRDGDESDIVDFAEMIRAQAGESGAVAVSPDDISTARLPEPGDELYVLGSNGKIRAGTITSIAENGATGQPTTVGLALLRRADLILKKMSEMELELGGGDNFADDPLWQGSVASEGVESYGDAGGIIEPPPVDPLDGLEVIVKGTSTFGTIKSLPERRYKLGRNMFDEEVLSFQGYEGEGSVMGYVPQQEEEVLDQDIKHPPSMINDGSQPLDTDSVPSGWESSVAKDIEVDNISEDEVKTAAEEAAKAAAEAEAAAAEAKRKAEKMEMLKKRAEEAMARRRKKKTQQKDDKQ